MTGLGEQMLEVSSQEFKVELVTVAALLQPHLPAWVQEWKRWARRAFFGWWWLLFLPDTLVPLCTYCIVLNNMLWFINPFIYCQTSVLCPYIYYFKHCCSDHLCMSSCSHVSISSLPHISTNGIAGLRSMLSFNFTGYCQITPQMIISIYPLTDSV